MLAAKVQVAAQDGNVPLLAPATCVCEVVTARDAPKTALRTLLVGRVDGSAQVHNHVKPTFANPS